MPAKTVPFLKLDQRAVFTPIVDLLTTSLGSLIVMAGLVILFLVQGFEQGASTNGILPKLLVFQILLNWPHFLVSYRLLYRHRSNFRSYPMATIVVPMVLLAVCFGATLNVFGGNGLLSANVQIARTLWIFAALYLAWHYTGQAWGVMMVFAHLTGVRFSNAERLIIRGGLRVLILWHVVWGLEFMPPIPYLGLLQHPSAPLVVNILAVLAFASGGAVLIRKTIAERSIDPRIIGPWVAVYSWYLVLWLMPEAFMFIQLSHAVQYLVFPARVEMNRDSGQASRSAPVIRTVLIYGVSILGGLVIFYLPEKYLVAPDGAPTLTALIAIAINIHHYYTDSAIWKMRDKGVRQTLFAHVRDVA